MSGDFTKIKVSRSKLPINAGSDGSGSIVKSLSNLTGVSDNPISHQLEFGELLLVDNTDGKGPQDPNKVYLLAGTYEQATDGTNQPVARSAVFKAFKDQEKADSLLFAKSYEEVGDAKFVTAVADEAGNPVRISYVSPTTYNKEDPIDCDINGNELAGGAKYFILCAPATTVYDTNRNPKYRKGQLINFDLDEAGIFISSKGVMNGAAWNDYAERRLCKSTEKSGMVVCEQGDGTVDLSTERLQPCAYVISDTYGFCSGKGNVSVSIGGKVLVYTDEEVSLGDCLCAGPNGKAVKMTREEISLYPDRILGIVSELPNYEVWGNDVEVDGRVWITVK